MTDTSKLPQFNKIISELKQKQKLTVEHEYTHTIVCPFCGYKYPDPLEETPGEEDIGNLECSRCEKVFTATRHISILYSTEKVSNK